MTISLASLIYFCITGHNAWVNPSAGDGFKLLGSWFFATFTAVWAGNFYDVEHAKRDTRRIDDRRSVSDAFFMHLSGIKRPNQSPILNPEHALEALLDALPRAMIPKEFQKLSVKDIDHAVCELLLRR